MGSGISDAAGSIQSIQNLFGKKDPNATNDMLNGQAVATGTRGAKTVADPNQGLSDDQLRNRKLLGIGAGALANGLQQASPQRGNPNAMNQIQFANQPRYSPLTNYTAGNPFFGSYGGY